MLIALYCLLKDDIITKMILGIWLINALCKAVEIYKGEVERRMKADIKDFNGAEMLADRIVYNNLSDDIEDVISNVDYWYKKILKEKADE